MRKILQDKINMNDINKICIMTRGKENDHRKEELYQLTFDENDRVSFNALWALTHFDEANNPWLFQKQDELIDRVLVEKNETKLPPDAPSPSPSAFRRRITPFRFHRFLHRQDYRLFPALRHPLLLHEARLRADEILSRTPRRVKNGIGYAGARGSIPRIIISKKANYEENQAKPWKIREIVVTLQT